MPLLRGDCAFYEADPPDADLERMARSIIAAPDDQAFLLVAEEDGGVVGFAASDNLRAQAVYDRVGGRSEAFLEYDLEL
jgi:L-amino acid N-acyltransferase YncA